MLRPTNPANPLAATLGSGAGQAAGIIGIIGTMGIGLAAHVPRAAVAVPAAPGFTLGANEGAKTAEEMGIESPAGKLGMGVGFGAVDETLNRADQMDADAAKLEDVDAKGAQHLREQAAGIREGYRGIAAAKAGVELASEFILPEHKLLAAGMGGAMKRVGVNTLKSLGEGAAAEIGGQAVNAAVYGDDFDLGQIARGAALEAAAGAPMIATSAFAPDQAPQAQPSSAEAADSPPHDPDTLSATTTIGGRTPLLAQPGGIGVRQQDGTRGDAYAGPLEDESAQITTMRPGHIEAALANAPKSMVEIAMNAGRATPTSSDATEVADDATNAEMTLDELLSKPDAPQSTRLQFSKNKPLRSNYDEVRAGDPVSAVKKHLPLTAEVMPRLSAEQTAQEATAVAAIEHMLSTTPVVTDAQGKRVLLANPERGSLTQRARHLAASHAVEDRFKKGPRFYKPAKAASAAAVPQTVRDYHLKAEDKSTGAILYLRRYKDGVHAVITDNQGKVSDFGEVEASLLTQRRPEGREPFKGMVVVDKRTPGMAPSLDTARVSQTQGPAQQQLPRTQFSAAVAKVKTATPKSVTGALTLLKDRLTGLLNHRVLTFADAAEFLASGYAREGAFTAEETAGMQDAEAFYDTLTGHTIVFTGQITLREGETPIRAVARVLLHERVGHDGLNTLLAQDARAAARWNQLAAQIPAAELDAIAAEAGYTHLATDRAQLALEWLARQVESVEGARNAAAIERSLTGTARQLW